MDILEKTGLLTTLQRVLQSNPAGLSEYQLIQQLKQLQQPLFIGANLSDVLSLFRTHFLLFHGLYRLRDTLRAAEQDLQINPLLIQLLPAPASYAATTQALNLNDPLRAYYLDLNNLTATDRAAVEQLLNNTRNQLDPPDAVLEALAELGIEQPLHSLSSKDLRSHYRQLVSRHHPDRGGSTERLQHINRAMDIIMTYQA